jgi:hypothetical protein
VLKIAVKLLCQMTKEGSRLSVKLELVLMSLTFIEAQSMSGTGTKEKNQLRQKSQNISLCA